MLASGHDLADFLEPVRNDDLVQAVFPFGLRNRENDPVDRGRGLEHAEGVYKQGQTAQREKLLRDGSAHPQTPSRGGHKGDGASNHARLETPPARSLL